MYGKAKCACPTIHVVRVQDANHAPAARLTGKPADQSAIRPRDFVAGNCEKATYKSTRTSSTIVGEWERNGLIRLVI